VAPTLSPFPSRLVWGPAADYCARGEETLRLVEAILTPGCRVHCLCRAIDIAAARDAEHGGHRARTGRAASFTTVCGCVTTCLGDLAAPAIACVSFTVSKLVLSLYRRYRYTVTVKRLELEP
jgi:hypothetical protein